MHHWVPPATAVSGHSGSLQYRQLFGAVTSQPMAAGTAMPLKRGAERAAMGGPCFLLTSADQKLILGSSRLSLP